MPKSFMSSSNFIRHRLCLHHISEYIHSSSSPPTFVAVISQLRTRILHIHAINVIGKVFFFLSLQSSERRESSIRFEEQRKRIHKIKLFNRPGWYSLFHTQEKSPGSNSDGNETCKQSFSIQFESFRLHTKVFFSSNKFSLSLVSKPLPHDFVINRRRNGKFGEFKARERERVGEIRKTRDGCIRCKKQAAHIHTV